MKKEEQNKGKVKLDSGNYFRIGQEKNYAIMITEKIIKV